MRRWGSLAVVVLLLGAGCLSSPPAETGDAGPTAPLVTATAVNVSTEVPGAEPVLAQASDGTIFLQGIGFHPENDPPGAVVTSLSRSTVWRSTDDGRSWQDVSPPDTGRQATGDGFVAVGGDDTVYAANAYGPDGGRVGPTFVAGYNTLHLFRSPDLGDTWERLVVPQLPEEPHRMWIVTEGEATIHMTVATLGVNQDTRPLYYVRSDDRGDTWSVPVRVHQMRSIGTDLAIGPDGALSIAVWTPDDQGPDWVLHRSTDGGATWQARPMVDGPGELRSSWQSLEVGPNGTLTMVWSELVDGRALSHLTVSTDGGQSWSGPTAVHATEGSQMLPWHGARTDGLLDVVWLQARDGGDPIETNTTWTPVHARLDPSTGELVQGPTSLTGWPIHEGTVCPFGSYCQTIGSDRSLLDYTWVLQGNDGHTLAALASTQGEGPGAVPIFIHNA